TRPSGTLQARLIGGRLEWSGAPQGSGSPASRGEVRGQTRSPRFGSRPWYAQQPTGIAVERRAPLHPKP
ncbi:MAG TPA: hypothetical protein VKP69_13390, partial [Isosphaeraceae bacterium]|nr:hypothetical protein [Isosphaeraceae bacterium]